MALSNRERTRNKIMKQYRIKYRTYEGRELTTLVDGKNKTDAARRFYTTYAKTIRILDIAIK